MLKFLVSKFETFEMTHYFSVLLIIISSVGEIMITIMHFYNRYLLWIRVGEKQGIITHSAKIGLYEEDVGTSAYYVFLSF